MFRRALEIEKQIYQIQRSTKTLFEFFAPWHNWFRMNSKLYYEWSRHPYSSQIHIAILILFIFSSIPAYMGLNSRPTPSQAAGTTFTEDFSTITHKDAGATTANWDLADKKTNLTNIQNPTQSSGLNNLPTETAGQVVTAYVSDSSTTNNHKTIIFSKAGIYRYDPESDSGRISTIGGADIFATVDTLDSAIYFPVTDKIYVFASTGCQTNIWEFDPNYNSVEILSETIPGYHYSAAYNSDDKVVYLAGGNATTYMGNVSCVGGYGGSSAIYSFNPSAETTKVAQIQGEVNTTNAISNGNVFYYYDGTNKYIYYVGGFLSIWETGDCGDPAECADIIAGFNDQTHIIQYNLSTHVSTILEEIAVNITSGTAVQVSPNNYYIYGSLFNEDTIYNFNPSISVNQLQTMPHTLNLGLRSPYGVYDSNKDEIYLAGGQFLDSSPNTNIYIGPYDGSSNFTAIPNDTAPTYFTGHNNYAAYAQSGNFGYVFGGGVDKIDKYNFTSGEVTNVCPSNCNVIVGGGIGRYQKAITASNGKIYLFGGNVTPYRAIYVFDPNVPSPEVTLVEGASLGQSFSTFGTSYGSVIYDPSAGTVGTVYILQYVSSPKKIVLQKYPIGQNSPVLDTEDGANQTFNIPVDFNIYHHAFINGRFYLFGDSTTSYYSFTLGAEKAITPTLSTPVPFNFRSSMYSLEYLDQFVTTNDRIYYSKWNSKTLYELNLDNDTLVARALDFSLISTSDNYVATFVKNGYFYNFTTSGGLQKFNPFYPASAVVQSNKINSSSAEIYQAILTPAQTTPIGTSIGYEVTADNSHWQSATPGQPVTFNFPGTDLRWRATLTGTDTETPELTGMQVKYYGAAANLYFSPPANPVKEAGVPSDEFKVGLKDLSGNTTVANNNYVVSLSAPNYPKARFSTSPNGPWTSTLDVTIVKDQEFASFYYLNYESGVATIIAHSSGTALADGSSSVTTNPGPYKAIFSYNPSSLIVGNTASISAVVTNNDILSEGKTITVYSSSNNDSITQPVSAIDASGRFNASISSTVAGDKTITIKINEDNTFVEATNKLTFLPSAVDKVRITSNTTGTVKAGDEFTLSASLYDGYGNLATNSGDTLEVTSSDPSFSNQTVASSGGTHDFKVVLKTAGQREIYVKDKNTGATATFTIAVIHDDPLSSSSTITSDKAKLILGKDTANISVKIADRYGNGVADIPAHIKNALSYGSLDKFDSVTNSFGIATFLYTPSKEGKEDFHAYTDTFAIDQTLTIEIVPNTLANQIGAVIDSLQNSKTAKVIAAVVNAIVATVASLGLIPMIAGIISGAPAALHAITYAFSLGMEAIGGKKRRRSWGRVFDSTTGKGIDMATVRLFDQKSMKLISTVVTDLKGHFSFQPEPGSYVISVVKDEYVFPTNVFAKYGIATIDKSASRINSHYVGQTINVTGDNNLINLDIPIDPHNRKPTFMVRVKVFLSDFFELVTSGLSYIFIPSIILGSILSIFAAVILPTVRNETICLVYILVALVYVISHLVKVGKFGIVYDSKDKKPISLAVVSVFDKQYNTLKETRITDKLGRFSISVPRGNYRLKVEREGFIFPSTTLKKHHFKKDKRYTNLYFGEDIDAKKEQFISVSVPIDRKYGDLTIK